MGGLSIAIGALVPSNVPNPRLLSRNALIKRENFRSLAWNIKVLPFVYISTALKLLQSVMVDKDRSEALLSRPRAR
jgi:hypothetical protein